MDSVLVSVIVPVYNAEAYLPACFASLESQDFPCLETIIVDDGSQDGSLALCRGFAQRQERARVVSQRNQGPGPARNAGLALAMGEYVLFLDADDRLDGPHAVSRLVELAQRAGADIAAGGYRRLVEEKPGPVVEPAFSGLPGEAYAKTLDFRFRSFFVHTSTGFLWGKLYRRAFLVENGLTCSAHGFLEDKYFNLCCCACGARYAFTGESVYLYRRNRGSITSNYLPDMGKTWAGVGRALAKFLNERKLGERYRDLAVFHWLMGFLTVTGHMREFGKSAATCAKALREYAEEEGVRQGVREIYRGKHVGEIRSWGWRMAVWGVAALARWGWWLVLAAGVIFLNRPALTGRLQSQSQKSPKQK